MKNHGRRILRNFQLMDMCSDVFHGWTPRKGLVVEGGRLTGIYEEDQIASIRKKNDQIVDLGGGFLMPGLIDLHVHVANPFIEAGDALKLQNLPGFLRQLEVNLRNCVESGITTVRDLGAPPSIQNLRKKIDKGLVAGPRMFCSNSMISCPGGYPDMVPEFNRLWTLLLGGQMIVRARDEREVTNAVADMVRKKADWIKFVHQDWSYLTGRKRLNILDDAAILALTKKAREMNTPVAMHQTSISGFRKGLAFNVDTIEHMPIDEDLTDQDVADTAARGIAVVPTLKAVGDFVPENLVAIRDRLAANPGGVLDKKALRVVLRHIEQYLSGTITENAIDQTLVQDGFSKSLKSVDRLNRAGARIGFGTDCGGTDICLFGFPYDEMKHLSDAGMSSYGILRAATIVNAEILKKENDLGSIAVGKAADLLLLKDDPLKDFKAFENIAMVMKGGSVMHGGPLIDD